MYIDTEVVTGEATKTLDQSVALRTGWQNGSASLSSVPGTAAGNVSQGELLVQTHGDCVSAAESAFDVLSGLLEQASEGMHDSVRLLSTADEEAAEELRVK